MKLTIRLIGCLCMLMTIAATPLFTQNNCDTDCAIQCIGQINVSLDQDCYTEITPAMGAVGVEYYCNSYYSVELWDEYGYQLPDPVVGIEHHQETLTYKVIENECGNSCWGTIYVEYKYPPLIECPDDLTLSCGAINLLDVPEADGGCADFDVVLFSQTKQSLDCDPDYSSIITRTYRAFDTYGNESFCTHDIYIERIDLDAIVFPGPAQISCTDTLIRFNEYGAPIPWYTVPLYMPAMADGVPYICDPEVDNGLYCPNTMDFNGVPLIPNGGAIEIKESDEPYGPRYIVSEIPDDNNTLLCNAILTYTDMEIPNLPCKRKFLRQWEVREWWCHTELIGGSAQLISVVDDEAPTFVCPADYTVSTDHECGGHVYLPEIDAYDACSMTPQVIVQYPNGTLTTNGGYVDLDYGDNILTYIVSDGCYNQSTCDVVVTVEDRQAPVTICETFKVVSISNNSQTIVYADPFDNGTWDECGLDRFEVRRMDSLCVAQDTLFGESVSFCCSDVGSEVMVVFRAYDWAQNFNDCMVRVEVQDKIAPRIECPADRTIECQDAYDINNLSSVFGDPIITDNCSNTQIVVEDPIENINQCGVGTINRVIQIVDEDSTVLSQCKQLITIENYQPFIGNNIQWPLDYVAEGVCEIENIDPEDLPEFYDYPRFSGQDECALLGYQYDDKIFQSANGCAHIKRTWTVINWCGSTNGQYDIWTIPEPQLIEIFNTTAPEIEEQADLNFESQDVDCQGDSVQVVRRATDDCEFLGWYHVVTDSEGDTLKYGLSDTLKLYLPVGEFTVEWIVRDGCGNFDTDYQTLTMVNTKAPTPVCINGLSASLVAMDLDNDGVLETEMVELWASDFDAGSSISSCGNGVTFSLSSDTLVKNVVFDCEDIGRNEVQLWVTDQLTGYQDFCVAFVDIQDNNNVDICDDSLSMAQISGTIFTEELEALSDVEVSLGENVNNVITDGDGRYDFGPMPIGGDYMIMPSRDIEYLEGVSTLDLILIQRHILGIERLESPYKLLAADIDNDGEVSASDLVELRRLILGIYEDLPMQDSWRFVLADHQFLDNWDPWAAQIPNAYEIGFLDADMDIDFIAMKLGDVNASVNLNGNGNIEKRNAELLELWMESKDLKAGEVVSIPVYARNYSDILGWQMSLAYNSEKGAILDILGGGLDIQSDVHVNMLDSNIGKVNFSYNVAQPESISNEPLFTVIFQASMDSSSDEIFDIQDQESVLAEAYDSDMTIKGIKLISKSTEVNSFIESVTPNPWIVNTNISYVLMEDGDVRFDFFDVSGRQLYSTTTYGLRGKNSLSVDRNNIESSGIIYIRMTCKDMHDEVKTIILE